ncbi:unnamed protein product [Ostreobium quekettii]|uniref:EF-hand domain-containing protein n=1 Tax=Ostreobium quekettii TaxID=121088 RepID=A0A8S1IW78_9CHLO|nr:unnamed protein product [Ostreobium quekettii]|eukprot:evm.model.scf_600EXC.2 EVM.evm.TU.scf_600EXC.2   scf_600EXC:24061-28091(-)
MQDLEGGGGHDPNTEPLLTGEDAESADGGAGSAAKSLARRGLHKASRFVEDAFFGVKRAHPLETRAARRWHRVAAKARGPMVAALWGYVLLTLFERPQWCIRSRQMGHQDPCADPKYPTFDLASELLFLALLVGQLGVEYMSFGRGAFEGRLDRLFAGLLALALADLVYAYCTPYSWTRLAPFVRIALLAVRHKEIHGQLEVMYRILPAFGSISALFALFVLLYAWCGCILFSRDEASGIEDALFFPNLWEGMWTLVVLTTTNNSPDMIMPAYSSNRMSILYYMTFLLLAYFFGLNMITAIIYKEYNRGRELNSMKRLARREENLREAFRWLDDGTGIVSAERMMEVFVELNKTTEMEHIAEDHAKLLFAAVDVDGDGAVTQEEFMSVCDVLQVRFVEVKTSAPFEVRFPSMHRLSWFRHFCAFINGRVFDSIIDAVLLMNAVVFVMESSRPLGWDVPDTGKLSIISGWAEPCLSILFVAEAIAKVCINGWLAYWRKLRNKFDLAVTTGTVAATVVLHVPGAYGNAKLIQWFQACRALRAVRHLASCKGFKAICSTFAKVLGPASRLLKVLFVLVFLFSALGVEIFGGRINRDPESPYKDLLERKAPGFAHPSPKFDFLPVNFNDMPSGMVTMFMLLVVNNWDVLVSGFVAVTSPWFRIFFVAFHFLGVLLCLNLATSFIIDIAIEYYSLEDRCRNGPEAGGAALGNEIVFEARCVAGTDTGLGGTYRATAMPNMPIAQDARDLMNRIFQGRANWSGASSSRQDSGESTAREVLSHLQSIGSDIDRRNLPVVYEQDDRP